MSRIRTFFPCLVLWSTVTIVASTAIAQDPCDSLEIIRIGYHPFSDTAMQVVALNHGPTFMSNPQFTLFEDNGNVVAVEQMNFFGIGENEQSHPLYLLPGMSLPASPLTGTLQLTYVGNDDLDTCTFELTDLDLCPPTCADVEVYLYTNYPNNIATSTFNWDITDSAGTAHGSGTLAIDVDFSQQDFDSVCLAPGHYILHMEQPVPAGVEFTFGMTRQQFNVTGPAAALPSGGSVDMPFSIYPACIEASNGIDDATMPAPSIRVDGTSVHVQGAAGIPLGRLAVHDTAGRAIHTTASRSDRASIDLGAIAPGLYILSSIEAGRVWPAQRFIIH